MKSDLLRIALVNDHEIVHAGLREMLAPYADKVSVVPVERGAASGVPIDIVLYDTQGQNEDALVALQESLTLLHAKRAVLFTWTLSAQLVNAARNAGVNGVLSKTMGAEQLVTALQLIATGQRIYSPETDAPQALTSTESGATNWPGRADGLTMREAEMITLISRGLSNAEIAEQTFLSPNSVKSYIRSAYRKIGVQRRSQAVAWGIDHAMVPDRTRPLT